MKKFFVFLVFCLLAYMCFANTYVHYSENNTDWCHIYDNDGKWIGSYKIVWENDEDAIGEVTLYNWKEKNSSILKSPRPGEDRHIFLKTPPKKTATLDLALSTSKTVVLFL